jgi:dihydrofolate synthase/folylpolyglutamate synthase
LSALNAAPEGEIGYQEALDYLYSFVDYSLTRNFHFSAEKFNLERMVSFLELLGNPHQQYKVIHVAGTKGKGSVSALIASALFSAGYRVGFYTSPHLQDYAERIQIDGHPIPHADFTALVEDLKPQIAKIERLTTFEITTALAFLYFARQKVDISVIEVGLGGRLDATNVISPLVSVITSISYDHTHILGDTLAKIATEKGGIIKRDRPVVTAPQKEEARQIIENIAAESRSQIIRVGQDYFYAPLTHSLDGQSLLVWSAVDQPLVNDYIESGGRHTWEPLRLNIPLLGYHQVVNAATAYATLQVVCKEGNKLTDGDIRKGFADVFWPGRFEVLRRSPVVIVDSAHNQDSALRLRLAIDDYIPGQPVILLFGTSEDKDVKGMLGELLPRSRRVIATQSLHPRAMEADKLVESAHQFGCPAQAVIPVEAALALSLELAGNEAAIVVAGSLFVAAAVRESWAKRGLPLRTFNLPT